MSTFLHRFATELVEALVRADQIEIAEGRRDEVVRDLALGLGDAREGSSLISSVNRVLLRHPGVDELFADDDDLKQLIEDLGSAWMRG